MRGFIITSIAVLAAGAFACGDPSVVLQAPPGPGLAVAPHDPGDQQRQPDDPPQDPQGDPDTPDPDEPDCSQIVLEVLNDGVSAAWIQLDGDPVAVPAAFPTTEILTVALSDGPHVVDARIAGSPGDVLEFRVVDDEYVYLTEQLERGRGAPQTASFDFEVVCEPE